MKGDEKDPIKTLQDLNVLLEAVFQGNYTNPTTSYDTAFHKCMGGKGGIGEYASMWFNWRRKNGPPPLGNADFSLEEIERAEQVVKGSEVV